MVTFDCECGESLRKNKVAKHFFTCRTGRYVTCIDCYQVFWGNDYEQHTSCISEAKKFMGNLYSEAADKSTKVSKQDRWTDALKEIQADDSIDASLRQDLAKVLEFDNIPRKHKPFANFVKNSVRIWNDHRIQELWAIIEKAGEKIKTGPAPANAAQNKRKAEQNAAEESARKRKAAASQAKPTNWRECIDSALAGGPLPWKRCRDISVKIYREHVAKGGQEQYKQALANIPMEYCSSDSNLVAKPEDLICKPIE
jgi:cell growth-regulating nucleolar protein